MATTRLGLYGGPRAALAVDGEDVLNAADVESSSEVSSPSLGQVHALTAVSVESVSELTTPALAQEHALTATSVESSSELTDPTASESNILLADDLESASELTVPVLAQVHALGGIDLESASELSIPGIGQAHALLASDVESAGEVTSPVLTEGNNLLLAEDIESVSEVSTPALTQIHALLADDIESGSEVSVPAIDGTVPLTAVVGGNFGESRKRKDDDRIELRRIIDKAAGLIEQAEEIAEAVPTVTKDDIIDVRRPVFKSQVAELRKELGKIRADVSKLPKRKSTKAIDKTKETINGIVKRSVNDIVSQIAYLLSDLIQEIIDDGS